MRRHFNKKHWQLASCLTVTVALTLGACSGPPESVIDAIAGSSSVAGEGNGGSGGKPSFDLGDGAGQAGSSSDAGEGNCGASKLTAVPPIVNILLVIDKSSSMQDESGFSKSKWLALRDGLTSALTQTKDRVSYGMSFFPFSSDPKAKPSTCETPSLSDPLIPIDEGATSVPRILAALEQYEPAGGTPTAAALKAAGDYLIKGPGKELRGTSYVLLATDGGPNCNGELSCETDTCTLNMEGFDCGGNCCSAALDPKGPESCLDADETENAVRVLADAGVKTFVVGIPGSELYHATLDRLAKAGLEAQKNGLSDYYAVSADGDTAGLADVLTRITSGVISSCELQLGSTPPDLEELNVVIDGQTIPQLGPDGWSVDTSSSPPTVVLKGATCKMMETQGAQAVNVTFGCPTVLVK
ncbi:MAG TPA: vWA domain-containing protein [Polyangiaceae bacterium]|nr:vWA domain-containing protein [Polyangiaceae bacterium]